MPNPVRRAVVLEVDRNELRSAVRVDAVRINVFVRPSAVECVGHRVAADCGQHSEFCPTTVQAGHCEDPELSAVQKALKQAVFERTENIGADVFERSVGTERTVHQAILAKKFLVGLAVVARVVDEGDLALYVEVLVVALECKVECVVTRRTQVG